MAVSTTSPRTDRAARPATPRSSLALLALVAGQFMANVDTAVANVAAPRIHDDLDASGSQLQLVVSGFAMSYAVLLITGARLGLLHGYRRLYLAGLAGFTAASLLCGLAPTPSTLILARVCQGAAAAVMVPQVLTGIQRLVDGEARTRAFGWYAVALSSGAVVGQVLGGVLVTLDVAGLGWRPVFLVNVPVGLALLALAAYAVPVPAPVLDAAPGDGLDLPGVGLLSASVSLAVVPLVLGRDLGWPAWGDACLAGSAVGLGFFVLVERRVARAGAHPLVDLRLLTRPAVGSGLLSYGAALSTYFAMLFVLALYLQRGLGHSALYSGLALVSWVAAFGVAGPLVRRLPRVAGLAGPLVLAAAHAAICVSLLLDRLPGWWLMVLLGVGGLGLGTAFTAMMGHLTSHVPPERAADLSGLLPTTAQLSGVLGVATFGTGYLTFAASSPRDGFIAVTAVFAGVSGLAALLAPRAMRGQPS